MASNVKVQLLKYDSRPSIREHHDPLSSVIEKKINELNLLRNYRLLRLPLTSIATFVLLRFFLFAYHSVRPQTQN